MCTQLHYSLSYHSPSVLLDESFSMTDEYYLQDPKNQQFYRFIATFTALIGIGKQTWWGYNPPKYRIFFFLNNWILYFGSPSLLVSQIIYFCTNYNYLTFDTRGIIYAIVPVNAMVVMIYISSRQESFKKVMEDFMEKIHLCNLDPQDSFVKMKRIKYEKLTRFTSHFMFSLLMLDWFAWCTITGLNNYLNYEQILNKTVRLETVIYVILPFEYEYNYNTWLIVHCINVYFVGCGCVIVYIQNVTNFVFIYQLIGHIEILKHRIRTAFEGSFTQEEIRVKLIGVIKHHTFVLKIFRDIQNAFGLNVTMYYLYNLVADSLNLYQLMAGEKRSSMVYALMVVIYGGGLVMISFVMEEIKRQSDGLADIVYNIEWEKMSVANRKILILIFMRIQPPLVFEAAGGLKTGVMPMISIMKTSFSYYVMLKSGMKT